jgi:hypothetical protein
MLSLYSPRTATEGVTWNSSLHTGAACIHTIAAMAIQPAAFHLIIVMLSPERNALIGSVG